MIDLIRCVTRVRGNNLTPSDKTWIGDLYTEGVSVLKIEQITGRSHSTVYRVLRELGMRRPRPKMRGTKSPRWTDGRATTRQGYIEVNLPPDHQYAAMLMANNRVLEHRLTMAQSLGRALESHETVHHINGVRDDNRIENLQLRSGQHGKGVSLTCRNCGSQDIEAIGI